MKKKLRTVPPLLKAFTICCSACILILMNPVSASGLIKNDPAEYSEKDPGEKKPSKKLKSSRNNTSVKIYPDAWKRLMHVMAKENNKKEIDFYVFDTQGTLVLNLKMNPGRHERIAGLARGTYIYRVFSGDAETASGNFEIR
jgi:hypothetical protein